MNKEIEVIKIVALMESYKVEITEKIIFDVMKIVYNYQDTSALMDSFMPYFNNLMSNLETTGSDEVE